MVFEAFSWPHGIIWTLLCFSSLLQVGYIAGYPKQDAPVIQGASSNYIGGTIFLGYIVAALVLTGLIVQSLFGSYKQVKAHHNGSSIPREKLLYIFVAFATTSFAVLSYNMLSFLIVSYQSWCQIRGFAFSTMSSTEIFTSIKMWTFTSTLFLDFAKALCSTEQGYWWVMQALMGTMVTNIVVSFAGQRHGVKDLNYYFLIGQILPISYSQNLFSIALVLKAALGAKKRGSREESPSSSESSLIVLVIGYRFALEVLPRIADSTMFIMAIISTRTLLYAASQTSFASTSLEKHYISGFILAFGSCLLVRLINIMVLGKNPLTADILAVAQSPAVSALGLDLVLWICSTLALWRSGLLDSKIEAAKGE
jgi:hypothetical protein